MIDHVFSTIPINSVYFEVQEDNVSYMQPVLDGFCTYHGAISEHTFTAGRWADLRIWSVTVERWQSAENLRVRKFAEGSNLKSR